VRRPTLATAVIAVAALAPAACGSSRSSPTAQARATTSTTVGQTQTATVTTVRTSTATTTTPGPGRCVAGELTLSSLGQQGGMGHGELGFALKNTSSRSCRTGGYPGVLFLDSAGRPLPTRPTRITRDFFGTTPVVRITLAPGQTASFRLGTTHEAQGAAGCTTAAGLQVIALDDTATLRTTVPDGAYECATVTVSPLRPGVTAYP